MTVSFWLEDAEDGIRRPTLDGSCTVDVAVVGAGLTGLWTAREVLRRDPSRSVLVLEARTAGFGASGRNGAWLIAGLGISAGELARRTSPGVARATILAMREALDKVESTLAEDGIDARLRRAGNLRVARGPHEVPAMEHSLEVLERLGVADGFELLDADALARRVHVADARGALFEPYSAAIHPGHLVRGLARSVEAHGGQIVEHTPVVDLTPRRGRARPTVVTPTGTVSADAVVIATEAWTSRLPGFERRVLPVYSLVVLTEPIDDERWAQIGWQGHELLASHRYTVDYLSRTVDGRILFGGRGAPYHFGSRIADRYDRHERTHANLRRQLREWFPALEGVGFSHAWGGPLGMPRDWMPSFAHDPATGIGAAYGYTGQGVLATNLAGRVLADLIVDGDTPYRDLPLVGHRPRRWEPEPLRWLGARYLQVALARIDDRSAQRGRAPSGRSLAERLVRH